MSRFDRIDLSGLPAPQIAERLDFESIFRRNRDTLVQLAPEAAEVLRLESEPLTKFVQLVSFQEMVLRHRINEAARGVMLAFARGSDLDHLAALFGVRRLVADPGDPEADPPVPATLESDDDLRLRTQIALEGFSVAGPAGAYVFHARAVSGAIRDVEAVSPSPGEVDVYVLIRDGDGTPGAELLAQVQTALSAEEVRPLCDTVTARAPAIEDYVITASIATDAGPDPETVRVDALAAVEVMTARYHRLGRSVPRSAILAALHRPGVRAVNLVSPAADIARGSGEAAHCSAIAVTLDQGLVV